MAKAGKVGPEKRAWRRGALLALVAVMFSCSSSYSKNDPVLEKAPEQLTPEDLSRIVAVASTNYGSFRIALHPEWAPKTCRNFVKLIRAGFYNGLTFHEVIPGVWVRGGDPLGNGEGGFGNGFTLETTSGQHVKGAVGIYHPNFDPNNCGSQFYVMLRDFRRMDKAFTVFGQVVEGMGNVERIASLPVTPRDGKPRPYMPLSQVIITEIHLEVKK